VLHGRTRAFNDGIRGTITNNGRQIGLMLADGLFQSMVTLPTGFSPNLTNLTQAACTIALPNCTTATMGVDTAGTPAVATTWMWADDRWPGPTPQAYIGSLTVTRVANNPF
jgi:phospholipase/lecithinase/hemolysin